MKVKSEGEVTKSCPTPSDPMDCSPPGPSVHGIFQARILEWGAIAFSGEYVTYIENEINDLCSNYKRYKKRLAKRIKRIICERWVFILK